MTIKIRHEHVVLAREQRKAFERGERPYCESAENIAILDALVEERQESIQRAVDKIDGLAEAARKCWHCSKALLPDRHHVVMEPNGDRHFVHAQCAPSTGLRLVAKWRQRSRHASVG